MDRMSEEQLRQLDVKDVQLYETTKTDEYIGTVMAPYGDWNYYRREDGSYPRFRSMWTVP